MVRSVKQSILWPSAKAGQAVADQHCEHKWVHLRKEEDKEVRYRKWVMVDRFYCEKCLEQRTTEQPIEERRSYAW